MKVKIWGCRGSITSPGYETLRYGGESTCFEIITDDNDMIIIDAGSGIRKLGNNLLNDPERNKIALLLTHSHWDHLAGFPFFRPAFLSRYQITLCGGSDAQDSLLRSLQHQMEPPYFPVDMSAMKAQFIKGCVCGCTDCTKKIPGLCSSHYCESIPLNHPNGGYGFKITGLNNKKFVLLTDNELQYTHENGCTRNKYVDFCTNVDLLFHDAQYTEEEYKRTKSWGHSTYKDAIDLAIDAGVKRLGLLHHDPDRSDKDIDINMDWCKNYLREKRSSLDCFACAEGMELEV